MSCRDGILKQLETKLTSGVDNDVFILMAASIYYNEQVRRHLHVTRKQLSVYVCINYYARHCIYFFNTELRVRSAMFEPVRQSRGSLFESADIPGHAQSGPGQVSIQGGNVASVLIWGFGEFY